MPAAEICYSKNSSLLLRGEATGNERCFFYTGLLTPKKHAQPQKCRLDQDQRNHKDQDSGNERIKAIIEDEAGVRGRGCPHSQLPGMRQKSDTRGGIKHLVPRS